MNNIILNGRTIYFAAFQDERLAKAFALRGKSMLILGSDNRIWAVRPVDAERLIQAGFEAL